jgi:hypothetical protein
MTTFGFVVQDIFAVNMNIQQQIRVLASALYNVLTRYENKVEMI